MIQQGQQGTDNIADAYKSVIDFNKVVISISSAILAAVITYIVSQDFSLTINNIASPILLIGSFVFCLFGFGYSISAIQKNIKKPIAKHFSNIGGTLMLAGIIAIGFLKKEAEKKIDDILKEIEKTSSTLDYKLFPKNCDSIELKEKIYTFKYYYDSTFVQVDYSLDKDKILLLNKSIIPKPKQLQKTKRSLTKAQ